MNLKFYCKHFSELTIYELYNIMALRQEIFSVEQNCAYLDADGKDLNGFHLLGYANLDENAQNTEGVSDVGFGIWDFGGRLPKCEIRNAKCAVVFHTLEHLKFDIKKIINCFLLFL